MQEVFTVIGEKIVTAQAIGKIVADISRRESEHDNIQIQEKSRD